MSVQIADEGRDVYMGVLPRIYHGGGLESLTGCAWLWADIDAGSQTFADACEKLREGVQRLGIPTPQMLVKSGGGLHAYWRLLRIYNTDNAQAVLRISSTLRRLVQGIGGDLAGAHACPKATDGARILRVPGTYNYKNGEKRDVRLIRHEKGEIWALEQWKLNLPAEPRLAKAPPTDRKREFTPGTLPPATIQKMVGGGRDGEKHYTMMEVAVAARKVGSAPEAIRDFVEATAQASGVDTGTPHEQRHIEGIVEWTISRVQPDL
jgi:hypothetical protein